LKSSADDDYVVYTDGHVDVENDVVLRALASLLQREGVVDSLAGGYALAATGTVVMGWSGVVVDERMPSVCDLSGETEHGDEVQVAVPTTWVVISTG
jgi:hypothetical protein